MPEPTPEAWAQIRYDYEHTDRPIEDICAEHGITSPTLHYRRRLWKWRGRRAPIPREGPPAVAVAQREIDSPPPIRAANGGEGLGVGGLCVAQTAEPSPPTPLRLADASRSDPPHRFAGGGIEYAAQTDAASIVPRLQSAVARVLPAIEAIIARLAAGPHHPREMEQAGRALGALMRTLRELNALLAQHHARAGADDDPIDIDAFRNELARRINAFVDECQDRKSPEANPQET